MCHPPLVWQPVTLMHLCSSRGICLPLVVCYSMGTRRLPVSWFTNPKSVNATSYSYSMKNGAKYTLTWYLDCSVIYTCGIRIYASYFQTGVHVSYNFYTARVLNYMQSLCDFMYSNVSPATFAQREVQLTSTFQVRITPYELVNAGGWGGACLYGLYSMW